MDTVRGNKTPLARHTLCADRIDRKYHGYSLLDAGCRTRDLLPLLKGCREYLGTDLLPGEGVLRIDLEKPLPIEDNAFDIVVALDVLEHLDNPHQALQELYRVAHKTVLISLPNIYYISFRWRFMLGRGLSGKYRFEPMPIADRHRWVLSHDEAVTFICHNSEDHHVDYVLITPVRGRTRLIAGPIEAQLARMWPNLFCYGILFEITLQE